MNWFNKLLGIVSGEPAKDFMFVPNLTRPDLAKTAICADEAYIELFIESLRIDQTRSFATRFHGVVYSFATLAKLGEGQAEFAALTKPDKLTELDQGSIDRVLTISKKMLGPVPWRGGNLELQLGLFSIKAGNVLTPLLDFVTKVSETAGIAFVGAVKPFVPLISEGMDLIARQAEGTKLVVGCDIALQLTTTATCAIIAKQKHEIDPAALSLDASDGKLLLNGAPLQAAYCVFSIRATDRKPDFGEIPDLKESYAEFRKAVNAGQEADAREACNTFCRHALTSSDLITRDARRLGEQARQLLADAFGAAVPAANLGPAINVRGAKPLVANRVGGLNLPAQLGDLKLY